MLDRLIKGGTVVDGTGSPARKADVGIRDGLIVCVGEVTEAAREEIDATGLLVTPGWVDVHTHYDGQVTWDEFLSYVIQQDTTKSAPLEELPSPSSGPNPSPSSGPNPSPCPSPSP